MDVDDDKISHSVLTKSTEWSEEGKCLWRDNKGRKWSDGTAWNEEGESIQIAMEY